MSFSREEDTIKYYLNSAVKALNKKGITAAGELVGVVEYESKYDVTIKDAILVACRGTIMGCKDPFWGAQSAWLDCLRLRSVNRKEAILFNKINEALK